MPVLSRMELRGIVKNARESVIEVLETRFEDVPQPIREAINQLEDISRLKQLMKQAITITSLVEFQQLLG